LAEVLVEQKDIGQAVLTRLWPRFEAQLSDWEKPILEAMAH
ncbi:MAG: hypothetical protein RIR26_869, partial [Pseudomonadota bacterium]